MGLARRKVAKPIHLLAMVKNKPRKPHQTASNQSKASGVSIPMPMRVGGAFMALALTLLLMGVVAVLSEGWMAPFEWTLSRLAILVVAIIVGAFATIRVDQKASRSQVVALALALALIVISRFLPESTLVVMGQHWLLLYAITALLCGLVIRRVMFMQN